MTITTDVHVHSTFSCDAEDRMEAICAGALNKGLKRICFTDHYDLLEEDHGLHPLDLENYSLALDALKERFRGRLQILKGLEFGEPHLFPEELEKVKEMGFDMILAGIHSFESCFLGDPILLDRYSREEIFHKYYKEVLDLVNHGGFDVLAHMDLPKRYLGKPEKQDPLVEPILSRLAASRIALEINTSPLRKGLHQCSPDLEILQRYRDLGGTRVTVGSDAHRISDLGTGFPYASGLLARAGMGPSGYFQGRKYFELS